MGMINYRGTEDERFWKYVQVAGINECWLWTGGQSYNAGGAYGKFAKAGCKAISAHVWSYNKFKSPFFGPVPKGWEIHHVCENKLCVNPSHLEALEKSVHNLIGNGASAVNARKTHCPNGHPLFGDNLYVVPSSGGRQCRECRRKYMREYMREYMRARNQKRSNEAD